MLTEAAITKVLTSIASKVGYDLTKLGAGKVKELFQKEGHEIDDKEAERVVNYIQTNNITNNTVNDDGIQINPSDNSTVNLTINKGESSTKK